MPAPVIGLTHCTVLHSIPCQVWECGIGPGLKHRVKDNFLQWQRKSDGAPVTFGLRLKTTELAKQVCGV